MKPTTCFLLLFIIFSSVHGQDKERAALLQQLQVLKTAVLKQDKGAVAQFFQFPIRDANLKNKLEGFENAAPGNKAVDRQQFLKQYNRLFTPDVVEMFRQLDFSTLKQQNELVVEVLPKSKKEACSHRVEAVIVNNQVSLTYLLNTRTDVTLSEDQYCEEYAEFWQFEWKNGKLRFLSLEIAG